MGRAAEKIEDFWKLTTRFLKIDYNIAADFWWQYEKPGMFETLCPSGYPATMTMMTAPPAHHVHWLVLRNQKISAVRPAEEVSNAIGKSFKCNW